MGDAPTPEVFLRNWYQEQTLDIAWVEAVTRAIWSCISLVDLRCAAARHYQSAVSFVGGLGGREMASVGMKPFALVSSTDPMLQGNNE
jgi:hypothetical protein